MVLKIRWASVLFVAATVLAAQLTVELMAPGVAAESGSWSSAGEVPPARSRLAAVRLDTGHALAIGGVRIQPRPAGQWGFEDVASAAIHGFDPATNGWRALTEMTTPRNSPLAVTLDDGRVLVAGGGGGTDAKTPLSSAEVLDPGASAGSGEWMPTGSMAETHLFGAAVKLDGPACAQAVPASFCGKVLVIGGGTARVELFDPSSNPGSWSSCETGASTDSCPAPLSTTRQGHSATLLSDGRVLVAGGGTSLAPEDSAEIYDPATGAWAATAPMNLGRTDHTATLLGDGRVLVAGGQNRDPRQSAELYDPQTGRWTPTASMHIVRAHHSATLLDSGQVLVVGGRGHGDDQGATSTEVYNPATSDWETSGGALAEGRSHHGSVLLKDGRVLVVAGLGSRTGNLNAGPVDTSEIFSPAPSEAPPVPTVTDISPITGPSSGGATLTIKGTGFDTVKSVLVGGVPATRVFITSSTILTAVTPALPEGVADVTVVTRGGESAPVPAGRYTVVPGGTWQQPPPQAMKHPRFRHTATLLENGKVLAAAASWTPGTAGRVGEVFNPLPSADPAWTDTATMSTAAALARTAAPTATRLDGPACAGEARPAYCGKVLVAGGDRPEVQPPVCAGCGTLVPSSLPTTELFDATTGTWSPASAPMDAPRAYHSATLLAGGSCSGASPPLYCGRILVAGGGVDGTYGSTAATEVYDPNGAGAWLSNEPMLTDRRSHAATLLEDGRVLITGGVSTPMYFLANVVHASSEAFDPAANGGSGSWSSCNIPTATKTCPGPMAHARSEHTATLLADGKVLVAGGCNASGGNKPELKDSAEIFDPLTGKWTPTGSMVQARCLHTGTRLADGRVLVTGGIAGALGEATAMAEIYDPATGLWSPMGLLSQARAGATATTLPPGPVSACGTNCGKVLIVGGKTSSEAGPWVDLYSPRPAISGLSVSSGPAAGGTSITITGTGLAAATGVYFGSVEADSFAVDQTSPDTQLTVVTPPAGAFRSVNVTVTGPGGRSLTTPAARFTYTGGPGAITDLRAIPLSNSEIALQYSAPGELAGTNPPASRYVVKHSTTPITDDSTFNAAKSLCPGGVCTGEGFSPAITGDTITTRVTDLAPGTTYYFAVRPQDESRVLGPMSNSPVSASTDPAFVAGVGDLTAVATSSSAAQLSWSSVSDGRGDGRTPARNFIVKQSRSPITDVASFDAATTLCSDNGGRCPFNPRNVGERLDLSVSGLEPSTTYYYRVVALAPDGSRGPLSNLASVTLGCGPISSVPDGHVVYRTGYSLVGLPSGTTVPADSDLYGWFDKGAGGTYEASDRTSAVQGGRGYWAYFGCERLVPISDNGTERLSLPLGGYHASMVGNPSSSSPVKVDGYDFAALWDQSLNNGAGGYHMSGYRQAATLPVGQGAWVFSYGQTSIEFRGT